MLDFGELRDAIGQAGPEGTALSSLSQTPTARALVGILAQRVAFSTKEVVSDRRFEIYQCEDCSPTGIPIKSPFGLVCLDAGRIGSDEQAQELCGEVFAILREKDLHTKPALVLMNAESAPARSSLKFFQTPFVPLGPAQIVAILLAHPPRRALWRQLTSYTPLARLNPYIYKGPIDGRLFYGRQEQLKILSDLKASYALIGPRAMGKTSLMNKTYHSLKEQGFYAVRAEHSAHMTEAQLATQIIDGYITEYGADENLRSREPLNQLRVLIRDYVRRRSPKKLAILIDEADLVQARCPTLSEMFRSWNAFEMVRFIMLGFKGLRKAVYDGRLTGLMHQLNPLKLTGLGQRECGSLIQEPMVELDVKVTDLDHVVEIIHREAAGSPSRVQLFCHYILEALDEQGVRTVTPEHARNAVKHKEVRKELEQWFHESTTVLGQWLAGLAAFHMVGDFEENELIALATREFHELDGYEIAGEIQDLVTADILDYRPDGRLGFSFPAMREIALPRTTKGRERLHELRHLARTLRNKGAK